MHTRRGTIRQTQTYTQTDGGKEKGNHQALVRHADKQTGRLSVA